MSADAAPTNTVSPAGRVRSIKAGDVPEGLGRRYFTDGRGGAGLGFYVDAKVQAPAFRDQGRKLVTARADPNAIRDMVIIAGHRQWTTITVHGAADFRREAWLAGRLARLEVRGYRPTERDLQELERRTRARDRQGKGEDRPLGDVAARSRLDIISAVVRARVASPSAQARIIAVARERIADWLERGATFAPLPIKREAEHVAEWRRAR